MNIASSNKSISFQVQHAQGNVHDIRVKFYAVLILHATLFLMFYLLAKYIPSIALSPKDMIFSMLFSVFYFLLVWYDLYSRPYHHYLKNAFGYILRDLLFCAVALFALELLFSILTGLPSSGSVLRNYGLLISFYLGAHLFQYLWIVHLASLGFFRKNVMLVGSYDERLPVELLFQNINNTKNFIGQLTLVDGAWHFRPDLNSEAKYIWKPLGDFLFSRNINELIICMDAELSPEAMQQCATWCHENSIGYYLIPDIRKLPRAFPWQARLSTLPSIERYCPNRDSLIMISLKRGFDILVSALMLFALSPIFLLISLLIKAEDGGPIFYISKRVGIHGKSIWFYKFRSMVPNAEALKQSLLALNERPDGPLFKLTDDPRVTRIGRFLRKTSLDEIPQFINVLKGDMSLIGPRPHLPNEVAEYSDRDNLRLECIPGISGLPQIYGRDTVGFREWVDLDLKYRKEWSFAYDLLIMARTVKVVLTPLITRPKGSSAR